MLADVEQNGELEFANNLLKRAGEDTDVSNERMRVTGQTTDQLTGDTIWLTPRLREAVGHTTLAAAELIGDTIASRWSHGEPTRRARKNAVSGDEKICSDSVMGGAPAPYQIPH